ncbi:MAG: hypothetical protein FWF34_02670 [Alphaproteobacteria bacterium]|nr:hypothetical protein [Alphaproteobacteria bacterium]MCL2890134.1 hypothetical protein [Alphaproteobacteria bacterium]
MRKILLSTVCCLLLAACGGISAGKGSENLVKFNNEPTECRFLHRIDVDVSAYNAEDANQFLRNRIAAQPVHGNAYWIVSERTRRNEGAVFGPKNTFYFTANVYDCPSSVLYGRK